MGIGTSAAEVALSKESSENATAETNAKTSFAYIVEYIKMPMRCFRVPYDGMRLSEDAKRAIRKVYTEREALQFLRTYGSHLPFGMHTLGGVFFRNMSMQTREDCKLSHCLLQQEIKCPLKWMLLVLIQTVVSNHV